jgi:hypothetical protein
VGSAVRVADAAGEFVLVAPIVCHGTPAPLPETVATAVEVTLGDVLPAPGSNGASDGNALTETDGLATTDGEAAPSPDGVAS